MPPDRDPTQDQLLAMSYADGEMGDAERKAFEERLAAEPDLSREVAQYLSLSVMARKLAPPEPMDYEWQRIASDPLHRAGSGLGWLLLTISAIGLSLWAMLEILRSDLDLAPKSLVLALMMGSAILLFVTGRARLRTLPYDRYTGVER